MHFLLDETAGHALLATLESEAAIVTLGRAVDESLKVTKVLC